MRKVKLQLESLAVESFDTRPPEPPEGTVAAHQVWLTDGTCLNTCGSCFLTCGTCYDTCAQTCPNTCWASCGGTCVENTCANTCFRTCVYAYCGPRTAGTCYLPCG
jgi:hypothetical protein